MGRRANPSGITLTERDAELVKGMIARGDRQHDIAAWFGVNGGRIAEIATGVRFSSVAASSAESLPPRGPYPTGLIYTAALEALSSVKNTLEAVDQNR